MRSVRPMLLFTLLVLGAALPARGQSPTETSPIKRVLVVHSYNPGYIWTDAVAQGVQEGLRGIRTTVETLYLDAKRDQDPVSLKAKAQSFLQRIEAWKPQVVITSDDAAQAYLVQPHLKGRASPQVIFCGVNAPLETYGFPAANVSGVRERWHFRESFALFKKLVPGAKRVALLTDGSDSSSHVLADLRQDQRQNGPYSLKLIAVDQAETFQQWQRKVQSYQSRADALALGIYHSLRDERTGRTVPPEAVIAWAKTANRLPTIGFTDYAVANGLLCGVLESAHEQGYLAGIMASEVLKKKVAAGALPVRTNVRGTVLLNLKVAEQLGIDIPFELIQAAGIVIK
jgi:ABC-type uncharacterized transport system substrate-binding protein